jgi:fructose-1,6-bisphosphatase/inositol monophosphatase family enzyme
MVARVNDLVAALGSDVEALLRRVAETAIIRFRQLRDGEVTEKTLGEYVTVADHEAEAMLTESLSDLLPGSRGVGDVMRSGTLFTPKTVRPRS